jgi:hypothetical protein
MTRGPQWLELILGLLLGLFLGLAVSWWIAPNAHMDPTPAALRTDYKDEYRLLVASAFSATGDLGRAQVRLSLLKDADPANDLIDQALRLRSGQTQSALFPQTSDQAVYALALLANTIEQIGSTQELTPTGTFLATSLQPTVTLSPFELVSQEAICNPVLTGNLARIQVRNGIGLPQSGVEILVTWEGGQQRIFTGLKPELGNGYADFIMTPDVSYTVQILPSSLPISNLVTPDCTTEDGVEFKGGLLLDFQQP